MSDLTIKQLINKIAAFKAFIDPDGDGNFNKAFSLVRAYTKAAETDAAFSASANLSLNRISTQYSESGFEDNNDGGRDVDLGGTEGAVNLSPFGDVQPYNPDDDDTAQVALSWYWHSVFGWFWFGYPWIYSTKYKRWFWIGLLKRKSGKLTGWVWNTDLGWLCIIDGGVYNPGPPPTEISEGTGALDPDDGNLDDEDPDDDDPDDDGELNNRYYVKPWGWCVWDGVSDKIWLEDYGVWMLYPPEKPFPPGPKDFPITVKVGPFDNDGGGGKVIVCTINPPKLKEPDGTEFTVPGHPLVTNPTLPPDPDPETVTKPTNIDPILPTGWFYNKTFGNYYVPQNVTADSLEYNGESHAWGDSISGDTEAIEAAYQTVLGRASDSNGLAYYLTQTHTLWELIGIMISGDEYQGMSSPPGDPRIKINWIYSAFWETWIYIGELTGPDALIGWVWFDSTETWYWITDGFIFIPGATEMNFLTGPGTGQNIGEFNGVQTKTGSNFEYPKFTSGGGSGVGGGNFGPCIIFGNNNPSTNGWFWSFRFGWIYGNTSTGWYYIYKWSDWFWFGVCSGGSGWAYSFWHRIWFWCFFGKFSTATGQSPEDLGGGGVTVGGFPGTKSGPPFSGPDNGNNGEGENSDSGGPNPLTKIPSKPPIAIDLGLNIVADTVTEVLTTTTVSHPDGDYEVADQVNVTGGEFIGLDPANGTAIENWAFDRILSVADVKLIYDTIYGIGNHGFVNENSADGGVWVGAESSLLFTTPNLNDAFDGTNDTRYAASIKDLLVAEPNENETKGFSNVRSFFKEIDESTQTFTTPEDAALSPPSETGFSVSWKKIKPASAYAVQISNSQAYLSYNGQNYEWSDTVGYSFSAVPNTTKIEAIYRVVLNRGSDPGGLAFWSSSQFAHTSLFDMIEYFLGSVEYQNMSNPPGDPRPGATEWASFSRTEYIVRNEFKSFSNLTPDETYYVRIKGINQSLNTDWSKTLMARIPVIVGIGPIYSPGIV